MMFQSPLPIAVRHMFFCLPVFCHLDNRGRTSFNRKMVGYSKREFKNVKDRVNLKLLKTKTFGCGAVTLYYVLLKEMT